MVAIHLWMGLCGCVQCAPGVHMGDSTSTHLGMRRQLDNNGHAIPAWHGHGRQVGGTHLPMSRSQPPRRTICTVKGNRTCPRTWSGAQLTGCPGLILLLPSMLTVRAPYR